MSDNVPQPPAPNKQTSTVPLKKETVRVTLKAADAPPASPVATVPGAAPVLPPTPPAPPVPTAPAVPGAPRPTVPARTIALKTAGGPPTAPTPTKPATSVGAQTIALKTAAPLPSKPGAPTLPKATMQLQTPSLPKATMQLQAPTQPLSGTAVSASQMATLKMEDSEEEAPPSTLIKVLSVLGFLAACVVFYFQYDISKTWVEVADRDPAIKGDYWAQLVAPEPNSEYNDASASDAAKAPRKEP